MSITQPLAISNEQKEHFVQQGFLKLEQAVSPELVEELRAAMDRLCVQHASQQNFVVLTGGNGKEFVCGIDKIVGQPEPLFAALLGSPLLLSLAEAICGEDFFPAQDFAVIKNRGDANPVNWHQDVITKPESKTFMVGIYLDPSNEENGALRIIPGSHKTGLPICDLEKMPYQTLSMQPGDVLVHDLMIAHSSGTLASFDRRRVVYFEFMSTAFVRSEKIYPEEFIRLRTSLIPLSIQCFREKYPEAKPFEWKHPERETYAEATDPKAAICAICDSPMRVKAASYCFAHLYEDAAPVKMG